MKACLLGKTLKHSFSKEIHENMGMPYDLVEIAEENLLQFVKSGEYDGYNVTIPYKEKIIPLLSELDVSAQSVGAVNTVVSKNGKTIGYNTDIDGMEYLFNSNGVSLQGKNVVVMGTGGTSKTACALLKNKGAAKITVIGLECKWNYSNYDQLTDTEILINATPVGMYPDCGKRLVDLKKFPNLQFVADVIYNPLKTQLLLDAEQLGIPCSNGLSMLVYQAIRAEEIWQNKSFSSQTKQILAKIQHNVDNVVLVGMPSCGKTTVGALVAEKLGKRFVDLDTEIENIAGCTIPQIFSEHGEKYFRDLESEVVAKFGKMGGLVISCGGGAVLREENRCALRQNALVVWLQRDLNLLVSDGRPVSQQKGVETIYAERKHIYQAVADICVQNNASAEQAAEEIKTAYEKNIGN